MSNSLHRRVLQVLLAAFGAAVCITAIWILLAKACTALLDIVFTRPPIIVMRDTAVAGLSANDDDLLRLSPSLRVVSVESDLVTDAGMHHLRALPDMTSVTIACPRVTDAGLHVVLCGNPKLQIVEVRGVAITERPFIDCELAEMEGLFLPDTMVGDGIATAIEKMPRFRNLSLANTQITQSTILSLAQSPVRETLEYLSIEGTRIGDEAVSHLEQFKRLRMIDIQRTRITSTGVRRLEDALPRTRVSSDHR